MARKATASLATVPVFGAIACVFYGLGGGLRGDIGILLEATGGYAAVWAIGIALCAFACAVSLMIKRSDKGR